ncbi:MAG: helix-turn-helix domain-containing protein [bacterium]|nr:helix-turn-helix domain-containing protein [bacterium]
MENRLAMKVIYYKKLLKMTNEALAEKSGLPVGTISRIASGQTKEPTLKTLRRIAKALNCTVDELQSEVPQNLKELPPEVIEIADEINKTPELKNFFNLTKSLSPKQIRAFVEFIKAMKE